MPLVISFLAIAVLWRNQRMQSAVVAPVPAGKVRLPSVPLVFRGKR